LIKNSQPFGKNFQKTLGGDFFLITLYMWGHWYAVSEPECFHICSNCWGKLNRTGQSYH